MVRHLGSDVHPSCFPIYTNRCGWNQRVGDRNCLFRDRFRPPSATSVLSYCSVQVYLVPTLNEDDNDYHLIASLPPQELASMPFSFCR